MAFVEMGSPVIFRTHPFDQKTWPCVQWKRGKKNGPTLCQLAQLDSGPFSLLNNIVPRLVFALGGETLGGRLEGLLISKAQGRAKTFNLVL